MKSSRLWHWLILIALAVSIFGATSCALFFGETGQKINGLIQTCWGVDVTDPNQVAAAALIAGFKGNKDAVEGLTAYEHCRAAIHREKGDRLYQNKDLEGARKEYERALAWEVSRTEHQKAEKASLYYRIGLTYEQEGSKNPLDWGKHRIAGQKMVMAANLQPYTLSKAYYLRHAAYDFRMGGDRATALKYMEESLDYDPAFKGSLLENFIKGN